MKRAAPILALALGACSLAPHYHTPALDIPADYKESSGDWLPAQPADDQPRGPWWEAFNDSELNTLEAQVTAANQDIKAASARLDQARAEASVARAAFFPALTASTTVSRQKISQNLADQPTAIRYNDYTMGADLSYELDFWGRVRNQASAVKNLAEAGAGDLATMELSMHAELATDYFLLRGDDAAIVILEQAVDAYRKALDLTKRRHEGGVVSETDVSQAETQLANAETQAEDTRLKRAQLEHAIAVLTGQPPAALTIAPAALAALPPPPIPGLASTLLERRPDIAAAERRAKAANAEIGVARAAYFPIFSLDGMLGLESAAAGSLFKAPSLFWSLGPSAALTVIDGGRISALTDEARAAYAEAAANYRQTVLTAYQQVEDNLAALHHLELENQTQTTATNAAERTLAQAKNRYTGGVTTYLDVVIAQDAALQAELSSADISTRRLTASVQLIKALGGSYVPSP